MLLQLVTPNEATEEVLLDVHTAEYLQQLKTSKTTVAQVGLLTSATCSGNRRLSLDSSRSMMCVPYAPVSFHASTQPARMTGKQSVQCR